MSQDKKPTWPGGFTAVASAQGDAEAAWKAYQQAEAERAWQAYVSAQERGASPSVGEHVVEAGRSVARGAVETAGSTLTGAAMLGGALKSMGMSREDRLGLDALMRAPSQRQMAEGLQSLTQEYAPARDPRFSGTLTESVGEGVGSALAFGVGGVAAGAPGIAALGIAAQFTSGYYDALGETQDPEQAFMAGLANAPIGGIEAIPLAGQVARALGRINKASGGGLARVLARATVEGSENAAQEVIQTGWRDVFAKYAYDEDRKILEDAMLKEGLPAFIVGALFSGVSSGMEPKGAETAPDPAGSGQEPGQTAPPEAAPAVAPQEVATDKTADTGASTPVPVQNLDAKAQPPQIHEMSTEQLESAATASEAAALDAMARVMPDATDVERKKALRRADKDGGEEIERMMAERGLSTSYTDPSPEWKAIFQPDYDPKQLRDTADLMRWAETVETPEDVARELGAQVLPTIEAKRALGEGRRPTDEQSAALARTQAVARAAGEKGMDLGEIRKAIVTRLSERGVRAEDMDLYAEFFVTPQAEATEVAPEPTPQLPAPQPAEPTVDSSGTISTDRTRGDKLYEALVDSLSNAEKVLPKGVLAERLRKSQSSEKLRRKWAPRVESLVRKMRVAKASYQEVGAIMQARSAAMRDYVIQQKLIDSGKEADARGSGMDQAEAQAILDKLAADPRKDQLVAIINELDEINGQTRAIWRDSGQVTDDVYSAIETAYSPQTAREAGLEDTRFNWKSYYAPFRDAPEGDDMAGLGTGRGVSVRGNPFKQAKGRTSEATGEAVAYSLIDLGNAIVRADKLEVTRKFAREVEGIGDPTFAVVTDAPTVRRRNVLTGEEREALDLQWIDENSAVHFRENGKDKVIVFGRGHRHVAQALRGDNMTRAMPIVGDLTRFYSSLQTRRNPAFALPNYFARDLGYTVFMSYAKQGPGFARDVLLGQPAAFKELIPAMFGGKMTPQVDQYLQSGAQMSSMGMQDYETVLKELHTSLNIDKLPIHRALRALDKTVGAMNDVFENVTRYAAFRAALKRGMSVDQAALIAKQEVAVNFERRGAVAPVIGSFYAFANAGTQGTDSIVRVLKNPRAWTALTAIAAHGALMDFFNRAISGEDDDGENIYDAIPEWEKSKNWIFMHPGKRTYTKIPIPYGLNWFHSFGRLMSSTMAGVTKPGEAAVDLAAGFADVFNPLGSGPVTQVLAPTLGDPFVQAESNTSFTGKKIAPENLPFGVQKPDSELYWRNTSDTAIAVSKFLSDITQTDDSGEGMVEISPNMLEHWMKSIAGGVGSSVLRVSQNVETLTQGKLPAANEAFIFNRYFGSASPWGIDGRFSKNRDAIQAAKARYDELRKEREGARAIQWRRDNMDLFRSIEALKTAEKQLERIPNTPENEERRRAIKARFNARLREARKDTDS